MLALYEHITGLCALCSDVARRNSFTINTSTVKSAIFADLAALEHVLRRSINTCTVHLCANSLINADHIVNRNILRYFTVL